MNLASWKDVAVVSGTVVFIVLVSFLIAKWTKIGSDIALLWRSMKRKEADGPEEYCATK